MVKSHTSNDPRPSLPFILYILCNITLSRHTYIIRHTVKGSVARAPRDEAKRPLQCRVLDG